MSEKRLIDANALRTKVCGWFHRDPQEADDQDECAAALCMAIDEAPTVAAEPVRHARWKHRNNSKTCGRIGDFEEWFVCSACDMEVECEYPNCPYCTARMDAKDDAE